VRSTNVNRKYLSDTIEVELNSLTYTVRVYDNILAQRWLDALEDNLRKKKILEKNFCFLGFAGSTRNLAFLVKELNENIDQINSYKFDPLYEKIKKFTSEDFQYPASLPKGLCIDEPLMNKPGLRLKHESCNLLHRHFEKLQGTAWALSNYYRQADPKTKYAIRQLNLLCHEIESWVNSNWKSVVDPEWIRPSQITTFLNAPRYKLQAEDFELFKENRYDREIGGVYLHWSQVGKTLFEVFRDEDGKMLDEATCTEINHQKYYSGEFDVEWGRTITGVKNQFKQEEIESFKSWLAKNSYDWEDPSLALGYIKLGQVDIDSAFGFNASFEKIYEDMIDNLNIKKITIKRQKKVIECDFPYTLDSDEWKEMQIDFLKK